MTYGRQEKTKILAVHVQSSHVRGFPSSAGESVNVRILSRDRICASVPSGRVDREEGNALVGRSPPMMNPYSMRVNAPRIRPRNAARRGWQGWLSLSPDETNRFGTFHLLTETLRQPRRVIARRAKSDWLDVAENSNAGIGGTITIGWLKSWTARRKTILVGEREKETCASCAVVTRWQTSFLSMRKLDQRTCICPYEYNHLSPPAMTIHACLIFIWYFCSDRASQSYYYDYAATWRKV